MASPEPEAKKGLEPIYDTNDWEVLAPPPVSRVAQQPPARTLAQAQAQRAREEFRAKMEREEEERRQITQASLDAGEDDPFGGW